MDLATGSDREETVTVVHARLLEYIKSKASTASGCQGRAGQGKICKRGCHCTSHGDGRVQQVGCRFV